MVRFDTHYYTSDTCMLLVAPESDQSHCVKIVKEPEGDHISKNLASHLAVIVRWTVSESHCQFYRHKVGYK